MPYAIDHIGIYKIVNTVTHQCYVGQSARVKKRIKEHFRLLRKNIHPNPKLQNSFNKYGEKSFTWTMEVECELVKDLDSVENAFLCGDACFKEPAFFNIANEAKAPMRGKRHSDETKKKISEGRRATDFNFKSEEYRKTLSEAQTKRFFSDPDFVAKVKFLVDNTDMSFAKRARKVGTDTSSARKLALKYAHLKGEL